MEKKREEEVRRKLKEYQVWMEVARREKEESGRGKGGMLIGVRKDTGWKVQELENMRNEVHDDNQHEE